MWHNVMPEYDGRYQTILVSDAEEHLDYVAQKVATPFKALSGSVKNIFVSGAVAKKIDKVKDNIKQFFCGTAQKAGDLFKGVGSKIADGAKAVGNFVKNIRAKEYFIPIYYYFCKLKTYKKCRVFDLSKVE